MGLFGFNRSGGEDTADLAEEDEDELRRQTGLGGAAGLEEEDLVGNCLVGFTSHIKERTSYFNSDS